MAAACQPAMRREVKYPELLVRSSVTSCLAPLLIYSVCNPCRVRSWAPVTLHRFLMHWLSLSFPFFSVFFSLRRYDVDSKSANLSKHVSTKSLRLGCCAYFFVFSDAFIYLWPPSPDFNLFAVIECLYDCMIAGLVISPTPATKLQFGRYNVGCVCIVDCNSAHPEQPGS